MCSFLWCSGTNSLVSRCVTPTRSGTPVCVDCRGLRREYELSASPIAVAEAIDATLPSEVAKDNSALPTASPPFLHSSTCGADEPDSILLSARSADDSETELIQERCFPVSGVDRMRLRTEPPCKAVLIASIPFEPT